MGTLAAGLEDLFNNPFRVLGIPVNATVKDIEKSLSRAKALASIGREIEFDSDIPLAVAPERTMESLQAARGMIEQLGGRLQSSLWWFWEGSTADEMAFAALRSGDLDKAVDVWTRVADGKPVSDSNYSAVRNLGLYYLCDSVATGSLRKRKLQKSFELLGAFIGSDKHFDEYLRMAAGSSKSPVDIGKLKEGFGDGIARFLVDALSREAILTKNLAGYSQQFPSLLGDYISEKFIGPLTQEIEDAVSQTYEELKKKPTAGIKLAENVIEATEGSLEQLEDLLSGAGYKLEFIQGKVGDAVLDSTSAYFNHVIKGENYKDPGPACLELSRRALLICPSGAVARKLEADIESIEEWIANQPERERQRLVSGQVGFIMDQFKSLPSPEASNKFGFGAAAIRFLGACKPKLMEIKSALGANDEMYQTLSDGIAGNTLGLCLGYLMAGGDESQVRSTLKQAGSLYMSFENKQRYRQFTQAISGNAPAKSGCYIATMVYGDVDCPEVVALRRFRDDFLARFAPGRLFIRGYYKFSPRFVERVSNLRWLHRMIRFGLDLFVRVIR